MLLPLELRMPNSTGSSIIIVRAHVNTLVARVIFKEVLVLQMFIYPVRNPVLCVVGDYEFLVTQRFAAGSQHRKSNGFLDAVSNVARCPCICCFYTREHFFETFFNREGICISAAVERFF